MPRRRKRTLDRLDPNLTPLLDIVLQLITFFMMLIHFGTKIEGASPSIRLPVAAAALPGADLPIDRLVAAIDASGRLVSEGSAYDPAAALAWWRDQANRRRAALKILARPTAELLTQVILRADRAATYGAVHAMLRKGQEAGFSRFSLVVIREQR